MKEQGYNMHMNNSDYFVQHETNILREELRMLYEDFESMKNEYLSLCQENLELNKKISFVYSEIFKYLEGSSEKDAKTLLNKIKYSQELVNHKFIIFAEFQEKSIINKDDAKKYILESIKNNKIPSSLKIISIEISDD